jgi:hypothetical protein
MRTAIALLAALAGCAKAPDWQKPGASPDAVATDLQACRMSAPIEPVVRGPRTKPGMGGGFDNMVEREGERMMRDERHAAECMRAKGYRDANAR